MVNILLTLISLASAALSGVFITLAIGILPNYLTTTIIAKVIFGALAGITAWLALWTLYDY